MASHRDFVEYVIEQLREAGTFAQNECLANTACFIRICLLP